MCACERTARGVAVYLVVELHAPAGLAGASQGCAMWPLLLRLTASKTSDKAILSNLLYTFKYASSMHHRAAALNLLPSDGVAGGVGVMRRQLPVAETGS